MLLDFTYVALVINIIGGEGLFKCNNLVVIVNVRVILQKVSSTTYKYITVSNKFVLGNKRNY